MYVHAIKKGFGLSKVNTLKLFFNTGHLNVMLFPLQNTTAYLEDNMAEDQKTMSFSSLHWGREYCVSIKVEGNGAAATSSSSVSPKQCLQLPEQGEKQSPETATLNSIYTQKKH